MPGLEGVGELRWMAMASAAIPTSPMPMAWAGGAWASPEALGRTYHTDDTGKSIRSLKGAVESRQGQRAGGADAVFHRAFFPPLARTWARAVPDRLRCCRHGIEPCWRASAKAAKPRSPIGLRKMEKEVRRSPTSGIAAGSSSTSPGELGGD